MIKQPCYPSLHSNRKISRLGFRSRIIQSEKKKVKFHFPIFDSDLGNFTVTLYYIKSRVIAETLRSLLVYYYMLIIFSSFVLIWLFLLCRWHRALFTKLSTLSLICELSNKLDNWLESINSTNYPAGYII